LGHHRRTGRNGIGGHIGLGEAEIVGEEEVAVVRGLGAQGTGNIEIAFNGGGGRRGIGGARGEDARIGYAEEIGSSAIVGGC
jgi:hypothetical protein